MWFNASTLMPDYSTGQKLRTAQKGGPDVRGTHAALSGGGPNSHYILAWMTTAEVTLQEYDLYPKPPSTAKVNVPSYLKYKA